MSENVLIQFEPSLLFGLVGESKLGWMPSLVDNLFMLSGFGVEGTLNLVLVEMMI